MPISDDDDNVVLFGGRTRLDLPAERVLDAALSAGLSQVVIIGHTEDGEEYFASSIADGADVVWLLERSKLQLLRISEESI